MTKRGMVTLTVLLDTLAFGRQWVAATMIAERFCQVIPWGDDECLIVTNLDKALRAKGSAEDVRKLINEALGND